MSETHASPAPLAGRASRWSARRVASLVVGALLALVAVVLLGAGGTAMWADSTQRDGGYVTTDAHRFSTAAAALTTESTHFGSPGVGWLYSPGLLGTVRIRVTPVGGSPPLFVGIGRTADVDRYLSGVGHLVVSDFFTDKVESVDGGLPRSAPARQHFWAASGSQTVYWKPSHGSWTVVVMNADGRPGIDVRTDLGARIPNALWIAIGVLAAGSVFLAGGVLVIVAALRRKEK